MMADNVPPRRRGLLFGLRTAGLGGSGLIMGYVASKVLAHWPTPLNFQISFIIGSSIFLTSCLTLWGIRDHVNPEHSQRIGTSGQPFLPYLFEMVRRLWQEPNYRILLFFLVLLFVATNGAAFIVAAAREQLGVTTQVQGFFSLIYLGTTAGLGWVLGIVADRYGYRLVTCLTSGMLSVAFLLCLLSQNVVLWCLAYGAFALACGSTPMVLCNMSAELCPEVPPSRLMGVGNVLVVSFVMIASTVCGAVVDLSGVYQPIFIANLMLSMIALFGFAFLVREPRTGQRYIIKVLHRD
jgi:MFS family permease